MAEERVPPGGWRETLVRVRQGRAFHGKLSSHLLPGLSKSEVYKQVDPEECLSVAEQDTLGLTAKPPRFRGGQVRRGM